MTQQLPLFPDLPAKPRGKPPHRQVNLRQAAAEYLPTVGDLPPGERPRARLEAYGSGALSTAELLAILIGTPHQVHDAERLLNSFEGLPGIAQATWTKLRQQDGIGPSITARIKAAFELGRRALIAMPTDRPQVRLPADVANLLTPARASERSAGASVIR